MCVLHHFHFLPLCLGAGGANWRSHCAMCGGDRCRKTPGGAWLAVARFARSRSSTLHSQQQLSPPPASPLAITPFVVATPRTWQRALPRPLAPCRLTLHQPRCTPASRRATPASRHASFAPRQPCAEYARARSPASLHDASELRATTRASRHDARNATPPPRATRHGLMRRPLPTQPRQPLPFYRFGNSEPSNIVPI